MRGGSSYDLIYRIRSAVRAWGGAMQDGENDYSAYTREQLLEARSRIDQAQYPLNLAKIDEALARVPRVDVAPPAAVALVLWPCGFWRRVGASCLDTLILGTLGWCLGLAWHERFAALGQSGRWIGFVIAGAYFIVLHTRTGQSLGKLALGLKVVRLDGTAIDVKQAGLRYLAFGLPWILNGMYFSGEGVPVFVLAVAGIVLGVLVFSGAFGNLYLLMFNVPSRRLVHDWIAGTVVVRTGALPCVPEASRVGVKRVHLAIVVGLVAAIFGALIWVGMTFGTGFRDLEGLMSIQRQVNAIPGVQSAQVTESWSRRGSQSQQRTLNVAIRLKPGAHEHRRAIALAAVAKGLEGWTHVESEGIAVQVVEGYDIGITSRWWKESEGHTAGQWGEILKKARIGEKMGVAL